MRAAAAGPIGRCRIERATRRSDDGTRCRVAPGFLTCPTPFSRAPSNSWLVLAIVCLAQFMVVFDATVVGVLELVIHDPLHPAAPRHS
jgi:hypothetical protein